ncbi:hypothetical protein KK060_23305 [Fulvivirgaceae bacterium PWU20]|uniref:Uncharacterized protein n=2 Tax=Chryseosolibacter indicus TaxID=2782351 RepID=A0ABS5VZE7_9BACT|nr:hypothetical protein [Chryseosolibacter indicus]
MKQREVQGDDNVRWTCVQAFAGVEGKLSDKATKLSQQDGGNVEVVCTPSGGAQTVRLQLNEDWIEETSDQDLIQAINDNRTN